jgi:hypothetical protein
MKKGWYIIDGVQDGDRRVEEQLIGLQSIASNALGRSYLDFGCAEALIAKHLVEKCGAASVDGLSLVASEIEVGRMMCKGLPITLHVCNLNAFTTWLHDNPTALKPEYDTVLLLSILHKLKRPDLFLSAAVQYADEVVIRLPAPVIVDYRSGHRPFDIPKQMRAAGFAMVEEPKGPRDEWCSIWRRG